VIPMRRTVHPEILDSLQPDDPAAIANRRDLRLINRIMGNFRWIARQARTIRSEDQVIELGAGDGSLGSWLLAGGWLTQSHSYTGVDLWSRPTDWPRNWDWKQEDLLETEFAKGTTVLIANLILHQFVDQQLRRIGRSINESRLRTLIIVEPSRRRFHLLMSRLLRVLGAHPITLQDARTSIRAGFAGDDLVVALGLDPDEWNICQSETLTGAQRYLCQRI
jgi:hypothetical protein